MPHLRDFAHLCIRDTDYAGLRAVSRTVWDWKDFRSFPTLHRHNYLLQSWHSREGTFFPQSNNWIILWRFQQITSREQSLLQSTEALRPLTSLLHDGSARGKPSWMQETCNYTNAILFPASLGMISPGQPLSTAPLKFTGSGFNNLDSASTSMVKWVPKLSRFGPTAGRADMQVPASQTCLKIYPQMAVTL